MANIALLVHFDVTALSGKTLTREQAKAVVETAIAKGYLVMQDQGDPPPFVQMDLQPPNSFTEDAERVCVSVVIDEADNVGDEPEEVGDTHPHYGY